MRKRELLSALGLNHELMEKALEIKPEFPFSELSAQRNTGRDDLGPIEPENTEETQRWNDDFAPSCPGLERDVDEDRTKVMRKSLEYIWKHGFVAADLWAIPVYKRASGISPLASTWKVHLSTRRPRVVLRAAAAP